MLWFVTGVAYPAIKKSLKTTEVVNEHSFIQLLHIMRSALDSSDA